MEKQEVLNTLKELREKSPKKAFAQSVDILMNLKEMDLKKQDHKIDLYIQLPHNKGKKIRLCAFVDEQLAKQAKTLCETVILKADFDKWKRDLKSQKKLAETHDFFIAQAEVMVPVAAAFGKTLGARGKMPSPKAGCVVPGTVNLEPLVNKLQNTVRLQTKNELSIKATIGSEKMDDSQLADNALAVYNQVLPKLPQEKNNLRYVALKLTMGPLFKVGQKKVEAKHVRK